MFFVNHDGSIDPNIELEKKMDMSRVYVTLFGASQHPDALPCTAISIKIVSGYDAGAWVDADCPVDIRPFRTDEEVVTILTGSDAKIVNRIHDRLY